MSKRVTSRLGIPPIVWGGTYRPLALSRYGPGMGWNFLVIGSEPEGPSTPAGRYLLSQVPSVVKVTRVPQASRRLRLPLFPQIDHTFLEALATFDTARRVTGVANYHTVVASGPPFHVFAGGYYLARMLRSRLVLDYRDEWTQCPLDFVKVGRWDSWWEDRCLRAADAVVFVTASQLEHQLRAFPALARNKCVVIPNGWEPLDDGTADHDESDSYPDPNGLVLSYIGYVGAFARMEWFLSTLSSVLGERPDLKKIFRLRIVGRRTPQVERQLECFAHHEVLEVLDLVPKHTAVRLMRSSTALLLLNPPAMERYIPGKLYDYIASRRPVLVFGEGGESATIVRRLDAGVVIPGGDASALVQALDRLTNGEIRCSRPESRDAWLAAHTREQMATQFVQVLEKVLEGSLPDNPLEDQHFESN